MMSLLLHTAILSCMLLLSCAEQDTRDAMRMYNGDTGRSEPHAQMSQRSKILDSLTIYLPTINDDPSVPHLQFDTMMPPAITGMLNGKFDGPYVAFEQGRPWLFGMHRNGEDVGSWYWYSHITGRLLCTIEHLSKRSNRRIRTMGGDTIHVPYRIHVIDYWDNGRIKAEGDAVYDEDWIVDYFKVGRWTYYDSTGRVRNKKSFVEAIE
jgi:hypothetical protein